MELKIISESDAYTLVALSGRLDIDGVTSVEMSFASAVAGKGKSAIIDMTEVSFIASLGMRMLLSGAKALRSAGAKMVIYNPQPVVQEALEMAGVNNLMPIENDLGKAQALISE